MGLFKKKDDPPPPPEVIAYREAKAVANRRIRFLGHVVVYGATCLFLLVVAGFTPALIVGLSWGILIAVQGFYAIVAPELRRKWIDDEVSNRLTSVSAERKAIEARSSRSMEQLSASIAHEIRNPITAAKSLVQQMGEDPVADDNVEYAKVALEELDRVERSISHLLRFAREEDIQLQEVLLVDVVDSALETFRDRLEKAQVNVERDLDAGCRMRGDPEKLRRVVINLVGNALDAMEEAEVSEPTVKLSAGQNLAGTEIWIRVQDNGPGIPADRVEKIFSPFHTSKEHGTGLGLAICKKLVEAHHGTIELGASDSGTEFLIVFPAGEENNR